MRWKFWSRRRGRGVGSQLPAPSFGGPLVRRVTRGVRHGLEALPPGQSGNAAPTVGGVPLDLGASGLRGSECEEAEAQPQGPVATASIDVPSAQETAEGVSLLVGRPGLQDRELGAVGGRAEVQPARMR